MLTLLDDAKFEAVVTAHQGSCVHRTLKWKNAPRKNILLMRML